MPFAPNFTLFRGSDTITSRDVERLFTISQRTARQLLQKWAASGFVVVADPAKKSRKYALQKSLKKRLLAPAAGKRKST